MSEPTQELRSGGRILVVRAPRLDAGVVRALKRRGFVVDRLASDVELEVALARTRYALVVTELEADGAETIALCAALTESHPLLDVLVLSSAPRLETALATLRAGAYDYLSWPVPVDALAMSIDRALQHRTLRREVRRLRRALNPGVAFQGIIGESPAMRAVFERMRRAAATRSTVLVTGETGTGKELVARALHRSSPRAEGPFVAINCAALPETLLESELFGHTQGAFTDAKRARDGLFVRASGGTLFLDELGETALSLQVKLLRALQDRVVRPVGGGEEQPFDARIVAATNSDLEELVAQGRFREDLYYRVHVIHIELPPLRARGGDVLLLAEHFLSQAAARADEPALTLSNDAARRLLDYPWPGNIRQLENAVESAVALATGAVIEVADLPARVRSWAGSTPSKGPASAAELVTLKTLEERHIRRVLDSVGGNRTAAAKILGIDRKSLYRKLRRAAIER